MTATATRMGRMSGSAGRSGKNWREYVSDWSIEAETTAARPTMRPPERSTPREMSTMPAPSATRMRVEELLRMLRTLFAEMKSVS